MGETEFLGTLVLGLVTLASLFAVLLKCVKPINDLNINIIKLTDAIEKLMENDKRQDDRIREHGKQIDDLNIAKENHEQRIKNLENN